MNAVCETWNGAIDAVDSFQRPSDVFIKLFSVSFDGTATASVSQEDNSDVLPTRAVVQAMLDHLDDPNPR